MIKIKNNGMVRGKNFYWEYIPAENTLHFNAYIWIEAIGPLCTELKFEEKYTVPNEALKSVNIQVDTVLVFGSATATFITVENGIGIALLSSQYYTGTMKFDLSQTYINPVEISLDILYQGTEFTIRTELIEA